MQHLLKGKERNDTLLKVNDDILSNIAPLQKKINGNQTFFFNIEYLRKAGKKNN